MAVNNPFGGFVHTSPLSSHPHSPAETFASNAIRDHFGPTVQCVADCLLNRGESTLAQIISKIESQCKRTLNEERERLVDSLRSGAKINKARGPEGSGFVVDAAPIRAALIVLVQHSIVTPTPPSNAAVPPEKKKTSGAAHVAYKYSIDVDRARLLVRYPRYVEYSKRAVDENAAAIVEEVLVNGRVRSEDLIKAAMGSLVRYLAAGRDEEDDDEEDDKGDGMDDAERTELREGVVKSFKKLVTEGYLELVRPIDGSAATEEHEGREAEFEFEESNGGGGVAAGVKRKREDLVDANGAANSEADGAPPPGVEPDDPDIVTLLRSPPYRRVVPRGAVWRVNVDMFHASMAAFLLGRLVHERYGDKVQGAGAIVSAALKLAVHQEYAFDTSNIALSEEEIEQRLEEKGIFYPDEIMDYLPPPVLQSLRAKAGGAASNLSASLVSLGQFSWPQVVMEVEDAVGHPRGGKFEIAKRQIVEHLRGRILHQVVSDSQGEVSARICSILEAKGYLEADAVAEATMVPAKDVREMLHRLYRANYISLLNLQQSKQHNPSNAVYLWTVVKSRMHRTVVGNVCTAIVNLRLRRQHEMEVGKDWIERAKEAGATDENEHEMDKANYNKFCQGLERLDNALLQLDETLMVLNDI